MRLSLVTAVLSAFTLVACATPVAGTGGSGGAGGQGGGTTSSATTTGTGGAGGGTAGSGGSTGGTGGGSTTSSSSGTTTSTEDLCGNLVLDPGEQCDGKDFGGKTCESIGFSGGFLQCNTFCGIVASGCTPPENCNNAQDDDMDGLIDCQDSDCAAQIQCVDSCGQPSVITLPSFTSGDTSGRPQMLSSACSDAAGSEIVYELTAGETVDMTITLWSFSNTDFTISVRTACDDGATEIACANDVGPGDFTSEVLSVPIVQGQKYYIVVDGTTVNDFGGFQLNVEIPFPESDFQCDNLFDDDFDGYLDCDDPSCVGSFLCMPGLDPTGAQCFSHTDCQSVAGSDPVCLGFQQGFLDGYCSEFCNPMSPQCSGDGICADPMAVTGKAVSVNHVCFDACATSADCRPGYECVDRGLASLVCIVAPEKKCEDLQDNDVDGLADCADIDCQPTAACTPGAKATGQPCTSNSECFANSNDPVCLSDLLTGYPDGYCSQFCDTGANDCSAGSICTKGIVFQVDAPVCLDVCNVQADCRQGYFCQDFGLAQKICIP
ncbi:MAG: hypothetical protein IPK82_39900 [Polyangiaceae bacterium]|nr:hypothetical protein [Polyangiaceae bacterium]